jgi:hypothetical protein
MALILHKQRVAHRKINGVADLPIAHGFIGFREDLVFDRPSTRRRPHLELDGLELNHAQVIDENIPKSIAQAGRQLRGGAGSIVDVDDFAIFDLHFETVYKRLHLVG